MSSDPDMDVAIQNLLGVINAYFRVDRTYIFEISADGKTLKNTYEYVIAIKTLKERSIYSKGTLGLIITQDKKHRIWCKLEIARFNIRK